MIHINSGLLIVHLRYIQIIPLEFSFHFMSKLGGIPTWHSCGYAKEDDKIFATICLTKIGKHYLDQEI